ncbi:MAG: hypothetical protein RL662_2368 [Bacteroidota bacterium]|jgi:hypothetical protein
MPCYDPPPPWDQTSKDNANQAVKLLCELTKIALRDNKPLSQDTLKWFLNHRRIDYQIATTQYYGNPNPVDALYALDDIAKVTKLIK